MGNNCANKYRKSYKYWLGLFILALFVFISIPPSTSVAATVDITLAWDASSGPNLDGYRVFHRTESGSYNYNTPTWEGTDTETSCTIYNLDDNTTYCFVARAFDTSGKESTNSNEECYQPPGNQPPIADAGPDQTVVEGFTVALDGSGSSDPSGDPLTFQWIQTAGPSVQLSDTTAVDPTFTAPSSLTKDEVLTFQLIVSDGQQSSAPDSVNVTVQAAQPYANIAPSATVAASSESVGFGALAINAVDGCIDGYPGPWSCEWRADNETTGAWISLTWGSSYSVDRVILYDRPNSVDHIQSATLSFSDGSTLQVGPLDNGGAGVEYTFAPKVITSLLMTVNGVSASTANVGLSEIEVFGIANQGGNQPPVADAGPNQTINEGDTVALDGSNSSDPDGTIVLYAWNFGDGTSGTGVSTSHTYNTAGTYTVTLMVTDNDGATDSDSTQIQVTSPPANQAPNASITATPTSGDAPLSVSFDGTGSDDPDGSIVSYSWNFGDGGSSTAANPSHTYGSAGNYTATLTVTDNDGATGSSSTLIQVTSPPVNQAPNASIAANPTSGDAPFSVSFDGSGSDTVPVPTIQMEPLSLGLGILVTVARAPL
jgi:PKD repeat protein